MTQKQTRAINTTVDRIVQEYHPLKIILYGSYAYGNPSEESDIDLLIIKRTSKSMYQRWCDFWKVMGDPKRRTSIEPIILTPEELRARCRQGDVFFQQILTEGKVVYNASRS